MGAGGDETLKSLDELIDNNGHRDLQNMILKMDIEGAEWKAIERFSEKTIGQFSQIVMELHWLIHLEDPNLLRRIVTVLEKLNRTHQIIHLHPNNFAPVALIGGVLLPSTLEVTYVRKADHDFAECRKTFPIELDLPCNPNAGEIFLGAVGLIASA